MLLLELHTKGNSRIAGLTFNKIEAEKLKSKHKFKVTYTTKSGLTRVRVIYADSKHYIEKEIPELLGDVISIEEM